MLKNVFLASPRGFCAGVTRAVSIVEDTLSSFGAPVYVRHEIVHNRHVVEGLKQKGAVFIDHLNEIKDTTRPVIISAHGAGSDVFEEAARLGLKLVDATCPLVERVHRQIKKLEQQQAFIIVVGKKEHPEITGTVGQVSPQTPLAVVSSAEEAEALSLPEDIPVGVVTQTTLSLSEAEKIVSIIRQKASRLLTADKNDICYATTHRQTAVKELAKHCDAVLVIGSKNSSNSKQLARTALDYGVQQAWLADDIDSFDFELLDGVENLGISAGASAPEYLVNEVLAKLKDAFPKLKFYDIIVTEEHVQFKS